MNHARLGGTDTHDPCRIDIVGDVHGAFGTLLDLLQMLGYRRVGGRWRHPEERRLLFLGDYIDRGPRSYEVYRLVRTLCEEEMAFALLGNHELNAIAFATRADGTGLQPHLAWSAATAVLEHGAPPRAGFVRDHRAHMRSIVRHGARGMLQPGQTAPHVRRPATRPELAWMLCQCRSRSTIARTTCARGNKVLVAG